MPQLKNNISESLVNSKSVIVGKDFWDQAIAEAEDQLSQIKIRAVRLKAAIRLFAENKKKGLDAPSTQN